MNIIKPDHGRAASSERLSAPVAAAADDEIDLGQLLVTLWRGKVRIAAFCVLALAGGAFFYANSPRVFQADALVQLEDRGGRLALPEAMRDLVESSASVTTETQILSSRLVLGEAVAELNLDWEVIPRTAPVIGQMLSIYNLPLPQGGRFAPFARPGETLELDLLQVPPQWVGRVIPLTVTEDGFTLRTPDGAELTGRVGDVLALPEAGFALSVAELDAPPGREFAIRQIAMLAATNQLRTGLSVSESGRGSGVLSVRMNADSSGQAVRRLDAVLNAYVRQNIARSAAEAERSLEFIREQLPLAGAELRDAQDALNQFREQAADRALQQEDDPATQAGEPGFATQTLLSQISRVESDLRSIEQRMEQNRDRYPENHPFFRQLLLEREALETRLSGLLSQVQDLPATQREIINLSREVELAQQIYFELQSRAQEMQVLQASTVGSVRIIDAAAPQRGIVSPRRNLTLALALVLGLIAGMGYVLLRKWLHKGVQDASDLEKLDLPVFATINYTPHADFKEKRRDNLPILALTEPDDLVVEAFRSLRTSLHFGMLDAPTKAIVITSSAPEVGKSFTSLNLAVVAAQAGQRVCLVDGDMRRGQLRRHFNQPRNNPGLAELLSGDTTLEAATVPGPIDNLWFIASGRYPPNPSELLMRRELTDLIRELDAYFDLIVVDSPPALAVTDPVILGRACGTAIVIARHDITPLGEVEAVKKTFQSAGLRLAGAILNGFDPRKARDGYGYGYRYAYKQRADD